ncbi:hypothetical protein CDIF100003_00919 [Clostridioides difficile]
MSQNRHLVLAVGNLAGISNLKNLEKIYAQYIRKKIILRFSCCLKERERGCRSDFTGVYTRIKRYLRTNKNSKWIKVVND